MIDFVDKSGKNGGSDLSLASAPEIAQARSGPFCPETGLSAPEIAKFGISTSDPRFDPDGSVWINGYEFVPAVDRAKIAALRLARELIDDVLSDATR